MNKNALQAFLSGQVTKEGADFFKSVVAVDGAVDVKSKVKSEKEVALQLESIERNIGNGDIRVSAPNNDGGYAPVPEDAIFALIGGKKGGLAEAKAVAVQQAPKFDTFKKEIEKNIEKPIHQRVLNEQSNFNSSVMSESEIKEYIRETVYDYIINEALGKKRLEKLVNEILKENAKQYIKEALLELKTKK
jgi:hypothetical protein